MNEQEAIEQARISLSSGQGENWVHKHLVEAGFSREKAEYILQAALEQVASKKQREQGNKKRICQFVGLVLLGIGVAMLMYTYTSAKPGGFYVIPTGLIGYGFYLAATGDFSGPFRDTSV